MNFLLGTHEVSWLGDPRFVEVPLLVSRRRLFERKTLPRAVGTWALDPGGFTELQMFGWWGLTPAEYVAEVRRYRDQIGGLLWAASLDWMCEQQVIDGLIGRIRCPRCPTCRPLGGKRPPMRVDRRDDEGRPCFRCPGCGAAAVGEVPAIHPSRWRAWAAAAGPRLRRSIAAFDKLGPAAEVLFHGTGLSVEEHQRRTVATYCELRALAPELPLAPVLQGWTSGEYLDCLALYERAGVDLGAAPVVGVGTMCRRQDTAAASRIFGDIQAEWARTHDAPLALHGFGLKSEGLRQRAWIGLTPTTVADLLESSDSLAWSDHATHHPPLDGHDKPGPGRPRGHKHCNNCAEFALEWRKRLLDGVTMATMG